MHKSFQFNTQLDCNRSQYPVLWAYSYNARLLHFILLGTAKEMLCSSVSEANISPSSSSQSLWKHKNSKCGQQIDHLQQRRSWLQTVDGVIAKLCNVNRTYFLHGIILGALLLLYPFMNNLWTTYVERTLVGIRYPKPNHQ